MEDMVAPRNEDAPTPREDVVAVLGFVKDSGLTPDEVMLAATVIVAYDLSLTPRETIETSFRCAPTDERWLEWMRNEVAAVIETARA